MEQNTLTSCPICSSLKISEFADTNYSKCENCKIVFQNPIPSEAELTKLYAGYYQMTDKTANVGYENYEENRSPEIFSKHYLPWIEKYAKDKSGKFIDFGCGTGNLILALKKNGYLDVEGCEFAEDAFQPMREKNIVCYKCKNLKDQSKKYKYISLIDVVEHLRQPSEDFKAINDSLETDGIIFIETINIDDFFAKHFHKERWIGIAPAHIFLFGITSLRKILELNGFAVLKIETYKLSGSLIKWIIIRLLSPFLRRIREKYGNPGYQLSFGDGVRIVAQKIS